MRTLRTNQHGPREMPEDPRDEALANEPGERLFRKYRGRQYPTVEPDLFPSLTVTDRQIMDLLEERTSTTRTTKHAPRSASYDLRHIGPRGGRGPTRRRTTKHEREGRAGEGEVAEPLKTLPRIGVTGGLKLLLGNWLYVLTTIRSQKPVPKGQFRERDQREKFVLKMDRIAINTAVVIVLVALEYRERLWGPLPELTREKQIRRGFQFAFALLLVYGIAFVLFFL